jgi:hypothetical protein
MGNLKPSDHYIGLIQVQALKGNMETGYTPKNSIYETKIHSINGNPYLRQEFFPLEEKEMYIRLKQDNIDCLVDYPISGRCGLHDIFEEHRDFNDAERKTAFDRVSNSLLTSVPQFKYYETSSRNAVKDVHEYILCEAPKSMDISLEDCFILHNTEVLYICECAHINSIIGKKSVEVTRREILVIFDKNSLAFVPGCVCARPMLVHRDLIKTNMN